MEDFSKLVPAFDVDNYASWSVRMKAVLIFKGLWKPVSQGMSPGTTTRGTEELEEQDQKAHSAIVLNCKDHHYPTLAECPTSKQAWDTMAAAYKAKSTSRRLQLQRELNTLKKAPNEPLTVYVGRAKALRDQLAAAGDVVQDEQVAMYLMAGLPSQYDILASMFEFSSKKLSVEELFPSLLAVEQRSMREQQDAMHDSEQTAYYARDGRAAVQCWACGEQGHVKRNCLKKKHAARPYLANIAV